VDEAAKSASTPVSAETGALKVTAASNAASAELTASASAITPAVTRGTPSPDLVKPQPSSQYTAADDGLRQDTHSQRWTDAIHEDMRNSKLCYICLKESGDDGLVCDQCPLSFHTVCYKAMWGSDDDQEKCPCSWCTVCKTKPKENQKKFGKPVGRCERCSADVHLECARTNNFYCPTCFCSIWPK